MHSLPKKYENTLQFLFWLLIQATQQFSQQWKIELKQNTETQTRLSLIHTQTRVRQKIYKI